MPLLAKYLRSVSRSAMSTHEWNGSMAALSWLARKNKPGCQGAAESQDLQTAVARF
jgi:hypothetical protein